MIIKNTYNFINDKKIKLTYLGYNFSGNGYWHQFTKVNETKIWSELQSSDLWMIEKTKESK